MSEKQKDDGDTEVSIGDLLAEVARKAAATLPDADAQRRLADSTIDSMIDSANKELADAIDALSVNLTVVEKNVSAQLQDAPAADLSKLDQQLDKMRQGALPGRQRVQEELAALREAEEEQRKADQQRLFDNGGLWSVSNLGKDDAWWQQKLASGGPYVQAINLSAALLGALMVTAVVDLLTGQTSGAVAVFAWRAVFTAGIVVYLVSLFSLTQDDNESSRSGMVAENFIF